MTTQLWIGSNFSPALSNYDHASLGTNSAKLNGSASGWIQAHLMASRGASLAAESVSGVTGPTSGIEVGFSTPLHWISAPIDRDITISGTMTFNLWASESAMTTNAAINAIVERLDSTAAIVSTIVKTAFTTELGTSMAANNFTATPTSTNMLRGDRFRVRVFADDASGVNMAAGTITFDMNVGTASVDGDSWLQFNETFGFSVSDPGQKGQTSGASTTQFGGTAGTVEMAAQSFQADGAKVTTIDAWVGKVASPADNLVVALQADTSGAPSGTDLATASVSGAGLTTSAVQTTFNIADTAVTPGATYWIVLKRDGALNATNKYLLGNTISGGDYLGSALSTFTSAVWSVTANDLRFLVNFTTTQVFLTDTNSDIDPGGASVDTKAAWTARGAGSVNAVRNTTAGWTAPLQWTSSAGGNTLEWYTPTLDAFTLTGPVLANIRALVSVAGTASAAAELAVTAGDGTGAVVWATTTYDTQLNASDAAFQFYLQGDDTAVAQGKRLRIRVYIDDMSNAAMVTGRTATLSYSGTTGAAAGDTYITIPNTLVEAAGNGAVTLVVVPAIAAVPGVSVDAQTPQFPPPQINMARRGPA